jgi:hypothetical protein
MKLKGRHFEMVSDIQAVLDSIISTVLLKYGKKDGIAVYVLKETILKEMVATIE